MEKALVIVESPTKAKTIGGILGNNYIVIATMGHVRDLPPDKLGIEIGKDFEPQYQIIAGKKSIISKLRKAAGESGDIYLATDEDREGEAIAWHITYAIGRKIEEVKRVAFHEIIPEAVRKAFESPRSISLDLVNSQQARRILDRIVGYTMSPLLSRNLERGLSAGRVQSVALRLIVEREKEIDAFIPEIYWLIKAEAEKNEKNITFTLIEIEGKKVDRHFFKDIEKADNILQELKNGILKVREKRESIKKIKPYPPFITSTLQQEASIKLGFSSTKTMFNAQQLYEGISIEGKNMGLITYMRTDSPSVAKPALNQAIKYIQNSFGKNFLPDKPFYYRSKSSTAQEAHEAIRPTSVDMTPDKTKPFLTNEQYKLYSLIWNRFVASQMKEAEIKNITILAENGGYLFSAENNTVNFEGFMKLWETKIDGGEKEAAEFEEGENITVLQYLKEEHTTNPPPRYTEASLIKTLEKYGIGRPSTYAPTISILFNRGYIKRDKRTLIPMKIGRMACEILVKNFPQIINTEFTAKMEDDLDTIVDGKTEWTKLIKEFYSRYKPMLEKAEESMAENLKDVDKMLVSGKKCPTCKVPLTVRRGRFGMFLGCSNYPKCMYKENIVDETMIGDKMCPNCNVPLTVKKGKFGTFLACPNYPKCKHTERIQGNANNPRNRFKKRQSSKAV
ncbi:MAG TPA: type I DNA topoisomerase [bacterium]|nr:type I DNA topoisomerase [bacterium]